MLRSCSHSVNKVIHVFHYAPHNKPCRVVGKSYLFRFR